MEFHQRLLSLVDIPGAQYHPLAWSYLMLTAVTKLFMYVQPRTVLERDRVLRRTQIFKAVSSFHWSTTLIFESERYFVQQKPSTHNVEMIYENLLPIHIVFIVIRYESLSQNNDFIVQCNICFTAIPSVTVSSNYYPVEIGNSVTLQCSVTANPAHQSVQWKKIVNGNQQNVDVSDNRYSGGTTNVPSLTITNAANSDEGYYICTATNVVGTGQSSQTYLDITGSKCFPNVYLQ